MAIITNEDVLNAIRGRYQSNPNNVSDDAAQAELVQIKTLLSGIESKIHTIQNGTQPAAVELKGSYMELYGATVAQRPAANSVPVGAYFMAVQTQEIWQSDGTNWVVI